MSYQQECHRQPVAGLSGVARGLLDTRLILRFSPSRRPSFLQVAWLMSATLLWLCALANASNANAAAAFVQVSAATPQSSQSQVSVTYASAQAAAAIWKPAIKEGPAAPSTPPSRAVATSAKGHRRQNAALNIQRPAFLVCWCVANKDEGQSDCANRQGNIEEKYRPPTNRVDEPSSQHRASGAHHSAHRRPDPNSLSTGFAGEGTA